MYKVIEFRIPIWSGISYNAKINGFEFIELFYDINTNVWFPNIIAVIIPR